MNKLKNKIEEIVEEVKDRFERSQKGYSETDLWNLDEYLAKIIKEGCFILAEEGHGFPKIKGMTTKKWKQILLDISFGFGSYLEMRSGNYSFDDKEFKRLQKEYRNGLKLFVEFHQYLWD